MIKKGISEQAKENRFLGQLVKVVWKNTDGKNHERFMVLEHIRAGGCEFFEEGKPRLTLWDEQMVTVSLANLALAASHMNRCGFEYSGSVQPGTELRNDYADPAAISPTAQPAASAT